MKRIFTCALVLCLILALAPPAAALTSQEQYYLSRLAPGTLPRSSVSYPARLIVTMTLDESSTVTLNGTCGMGANPTDEEMLALLTAALPSESSYKTLQNACDDKVLVEEITQKLKFSPGDLDGILKNLREMFGVDKVWDIVHGKLPSISASDAVTAVIDGVMGDTPSPIPSIHGIIINGVFVSYEEFQKDQERYKYIIALSQANERLRRFYAGFSAQYKDFLAKNGDWALTIFDQVTAPLLYTDVPECEQTWTANIDLSKKDGDFGNIDGTYTGWFSLTMDANLSAFDSKWHIYMAESMNTQKIIPMNVPNDVVWSPGSTTGATTAFGFAFEIPDCELNLRMPAGVNRTFFEIPIDSGSVRQTAFTHQMNRTVVVNGVHFGAKYIFEFTMEIDDDWSSDTAIATGIPMYGPQVVTNNSTSGSSVSDMRPFVSMTLIVDMLTG